MTLEELNRIYPGWIEDPSGFISNIEPYGGYIDRIIITGEWFVLFRSGGHLEGFKTKEDAFQAYFNSVDKSF